MTRKAQNNYRQTKNTTIDRKIHKTSIKAHKMTVRGIKQVDKGDETTINKQNLYKS